MNMKRWVAALIQDESGQDLIEYALLTTFIGLASVIGIGLFRGAINSTYSSWNTGMNNLWETPDPI
jgi:Flp pilus assembly pilin Flp